MKLLNHEIEHFLKFIFDMKLKGKESRMRTRLYKMIAEYQEKVLSPERNEIIQQYALRDENDEIMYAEDGLSVKLIPVLLEEFNKEYNGFQNEEYVIEANETNREILLTVGNSLLESDAEVSGEVALMFDTWCERFEEVIEKYSKEV